MLGEKDMKVASECVSMREYEKVISQSDNNMIDCLINQRPENAQAIKSERIT